MARGELIEERHAEPRGEIIPRALVEAQLVPLTHRLSAGGLNAEERANRQLQLTLLRKLAKLKGRVGDKKRAAPDSFDLNKLHTATIKAMAEKSLNALPLKARAQVERVLADGSVSQ